MGTSKRTVKKAVRKKISPKAQKTGIALAKNISAIKIASVRTLQKHLQDAKSNIKTLPNPGRPSIYIG
jgi:BioD-like phosphotransacetylase family protein